MYYTYNWSAFYKTCYCQNSKYQEKSNLIQIELIILETQMVYQNCKIIKRKVKFSAEI